MKQELSFFILLDLFYLVACMGKAVWHGAGTVASEQKKGRIQAARCASVLVYMGPAAHTPLLLLRLFANPSLGFFERKRVTINQQESTTHVGQNRRISQPDPVLLLFHR